MESNLKIKTTRSEILFCIAFFLYSYSQTVIANSYLFGRDSSRFNVSNNLSYASAVILVISIITRYKAKLRYLLNSAIFALISLLISYQTHSIGFGVNVLLIIAGYEIEFKKIVKFAVTSLFLETVLVIGGCLIGIVPDELITHGDLVAHTLGFAYYSNAPYQIFMIAIMIYWLLKSSKLEIPYLILNLAVQYVIYQIFTVRLVWYLYIFFIIVAFALHFVNKSNPHKWITFWATIMFPIASIFTVVASYLSQTTKIFSVMDVMLNGRLWFLYRGFTEYGLKLFGQYIQTSQEYIDENYINHYFFIDSGYGYILLNYGLIFSAILLIGYSVFSRKAAQDRDFKLLVWCIAVCVFSIINNVLFSITQNPIPILAVNMVVNYARKMPRRKLVISKSRLNKSWN